MAIYFTAWLVVSWVRTASTEGISQLRFFTEWAYDILTVTVILTALLAYCGYRKKQNSSDSGKTQKEIN